MWLKTIDGNAIFATHFVHVQIDRQDKNTIEKLLHYQVETDGIVVYPEDDLQKLETILQDSGLSYTIEQLTHDPAHVVKTQGVKYASRSEAIEHILNDKEPESMIVSNLKKKLAEKDDEIKTMRANLEKIEANMKKLNDAHHRLEAMLNQTKMPI